MKKTIWLVLALGAVLVLSACSKKEEAPAPAPAVEKPAVQDQGYTTPQEGKKEGESSLDVVQKNIDTAVAEGEKPAPPAPEKTDQGYLSPQEGKKEGLGPMQVVEENVARAAEEASSTAVAVVPAGKEVVVLENKNGNVTFPHKDHGLMLGCPTCHGEDPPQKIVLDRDSAHKLCRDCHKEKGEGPTGCADCHKK